MQVELFSYEKVEKHMHSNQACKNIQKRLFEILRKCPLSQLAWDSPLATTQSATGRYQSPK